MARDDSVLSPQPYSWSNNILFMNGPTVKNICLDLSNVNDIMLISTYSTADYKAPQYSVYSVIYRTWNSVWNLLGLGQ